MEQTLLNEIVARVAAKLAEAEGGEAASAAASRDDRWDIIRVDPSSLPGHAEVREAEGAVPCGLRFPPE